MAKYRTPTFPVDTHIHRLAQRWGLTKGKTVEQTEADLKVVFSPVVTALLLSNLTGLLKYLSKLGKPDLVSSAYKLGFPLQNRFCIKNSALATSQENLRCVCWQLVH